MPERSCITCRIKGAKGELLRIAEGPEGPVLDYLEKLPGRGAYVCPRAACIKKALEPGALSRAFKKKSAGPDVEGFVSDVRAAADRKVRSLLGMARRSGRMAYGRDSSVRALKSAPGGLLLAAEDMAGATLKKLERELQGLDYMLFRYGDKESLGTLAGTRPVGMLYISDEGFVSALVRELNRTTLNIGGE